MLVNLSHKKIRKSIYVSIAFIGIPLVLSAFMHLWNPVGFPAVHVDEGHYMRRAMQVLEGLGPQEPLSTYIFAYDHPYFGQLFLASVFKLIGYPDILQPKVGDVHSIEMLYVVPRVLMGILAVIDTFLVYKIAETRYNRKVAFIAATLFAVMPLSWLTRGIYLDSILLPFLLSSIYFAVSTRQAGPITNDGAKRKKYLILLSGIFLGLAIFTKTPAFIMIPLVAIIIIKNNNKDVKPATMVWLIPVILIPLIWPAYAIFQGQFGEWIEGVFYQASRETGKPLRYSLDLVAETDPVLLVLAAVGFIYSEVRRDYFIFFWVVPYVIFLSLIGWVVHFHWIMLLPAFCIVTAVFVEDLSKRLMSKKISRLSTIVAVSGIAAVGLVSTSILITTNLNSSYFQ
jgi:4-amino-4-deoxy-L-arabinose transferase-like glycosyltransferase